MLEHEQRRAERDRAREMHARLHIRTRFRGYDVDGVDAARGRERFHPR